MAKKKSASQTTEPQSSFDIRSGSSRQQYQIPLASLYGIDGFIKSFDPAKIAPLPSHPSLPNPRQTMTSGTLAIIAEIEESGVVHTPPIGVLIDDELVLIDGRTRITGLVRHYLKNGTDLGDASITVDVLEGTLSPTDLMLYALEVNVSRESIDDGDILLRLRALQDMGATREDMLRALGKDPKAAASKGWLNRVMAVVESQTLVNAVQEGTVTLQAAQGIAANSNTEDDRHAAVVQVSEDAEKRQKSGVGKAAAQAQAGQALGLKTSASTKKTPKALLWQKVTAEMAPLYAEAVTAQADGSLPSIDAFAEAHGLDDTATSTLKALVAMNALGAVAAVYKQTTFDGVIEGQSDDQRNESLWAFGAGIGPKIREVYGLEDRAFFAEVVGKPLPESGKRGRPAKNGGKATPAKGGKKTPAKGEAAAPAKTAKKPAKKGEASAKASRGRKPKAVESTEE